MISNISPYSHLPDKDLAREGRFIAEGTIVVRRLLRSSLVCESIVCGVSQAAELGDMAGDVPIQILPKKDINALVGFDFHRGALALGRIPAEPDPEEVLKGWLHLSRIKILLLPHCSDPQNLGALIRSARALGFTGVVVSRRSAQVYSRRVVRVAMGSMFDFPVIQVSDFTYWAKLCAQYMPVWGLSLDKDSIPLHKQNKPQRVALMLGNEGEGLSVDELQLVSDKVIIPMADGTDSLNIAASGAIAMYSVQ